jgi:hypothetical protein
VDPDHGDITGWIMRPVDKLTDDDRAELRRLCGLCPDLAAIRDLARDFAELVRTRGGKRPTIWIEQAEQATITEIRSFANGLRKDWAAVTAGLTMTWSSGAVEGNVNFKDAEKTDVRPGQPRPAPPADPPRRLTSTLHDHQVRARAILQCPLAGVYVRPRP